MISTLRGLTIGEKAEVGIFILGVLYTIYVARSLLLPIFLALLLAALLQPFVQRLLRWKIPESIGAAVVVLVFVAALVTAVYELSAPVTEWVEGGPLLLRKAEYKVEKLKQSLRKAREKTEQIEQMADLEGGKEKVVVKGPSLSHRILSQTWVVLGTAAVVIVLVYFLLAQGRQTLLRLASGLRGIDTGERLTALLVKIQQDIAAYLRTVIVINAAVGVFTGIYTALMGLPSPILIGVVAGVLNFIPYLGPAVTFGIISAISLATFDDWLRILPPPLVFMCFTGLEGNIITPMILGNRLTLNPIVIFLAILFWGWVWGAAGVFLAVPTLTALKIIVQSFPSLQPVSLVLHGEKNSRAGPDEEEDGESGR
jgi:predicted PurR-regulated permease PerM